MLRRTLFNPARTRTGPHGGQVGRGMLCVAKRVFAISLSLLTLAACFAGIAGDNLVQNASFENEFDGKPASWDTWAWDTKPGVTEYRLETRAAHSGTRFVTIENKTENDARYRQAIAVKSNTYYRLSAWVKTENVGEQKMGAIVSLDGSVYTSPDVRGTNSQWEHVEMYLRTGKDTQRVTITIGVGGYGSTNVGKASFDDVSLEEVAQPGGNVAPVGDVTPAGTAEQPATGRSPWLVLLGAVVIAAAGYCAYRFFRPKGAGGGEEQSAGQIEGE